MDLPQSSHDSATGWQLVADLDRQRAQDRLSLSQQPNPLPDKGFSSSAKDSQRVPCLRRRRGMLPRGWQGGVGQSLRGDRLRVGDVGLGAVPPPSPVVGAGRLHLSHVVPPGPERGNNGQPQPCGSLNTDPVDDSSRVGQDLDQGG